DPSGIFPKTLIGECSTGKKQYRQKNLSRRFKIFFYPVFILICGPAPAVNLDKFYLVFCLVVTRNNPDAAFASLFLQRPATEMP
ncbi:MAG TPA: hypothetical protein VLY83_02575, partial [Methanoregula sp.]|nr:hypothetical protein [Methanoregula sp.]